MNIREADKIFLGRDMPPEDIEIVKTDGSFVIGPTDKPYIDFFMGWCVGNIGWGVEEIKARVRQFNGPDYVCPAYLYKAWVELAELLAKITPGRLTKSFRATGGTEAVEIALRAANSYTRRHKFISIEGSYHGDSIGTMSIGSSYFRQHQPGLLFNSYKISPPLNSEAAIKVEHLLKQRDVAAFIMEPIICNLGILIPEKAFMNKVQELCKEHHSLLIIDEVATGFGRTGKLFASEHFGIEPDIMCLAKAITGGYGTMGVTITTPEVAKAMEYESSYYSTYGWYPLSVEAALANINYIMVHQDQLQKNVAMMGQYFYERLSKMKFKFPAEIRSIGLAIGVEFEDTHYAPNIVAKAKQKGVLLAPSSNKAFTLFPALNIDKEIAEQGLDLLEQSLEV